MKIKYKFILLSLFTIIIGITFSSGVSAYTTNSTLPNDIPAFDKFYDTRGEIINGIDLSNGYLIHKISGDNYQLKILANKEQKFIVNSFNSVDVSTSQNVKLYGNFTPVEIDGKFVWKCGFLSSDLPITSKIRIGGNTSDYWTNCGIYYENGDLVFPIPVPTLGEVLEKSNPVNHFQTMMSGIIKYLIVFIIGLVAFWKGWQFLSRELRKA